jgi:gliding motility-associated-like protein
LCLDIESDDRRYIDPATGALGKLDTVTLDWNRNIPGARWRIKDDSARLQEAEFCWTPRIGQARDVPYTFTITARDDACPLNAVTVRSVLITVKPIAQTERIFTPLGCGRYAFESNLSDGFRGDPRFEWDVFDSTGNPIFDRRVASFESRVGTFSNRQYDTMQFRRGGKYIVVHRINSLPDDCPNMYRDTIVVPPMLEMDLALGEDTFACAGIPLEIIPYVNNAVPHIFYKWGTIGTRANGNYNFSQVSVDEADTLPSFTITLERQTYDTAVFLEIMDSSQCIVRDTIRVFRRNNPVINWPDIPRLCTYDSTTVIPTYDTAYFYNRYTDETFRQGASLTKYWYFDEELIPFSSLDSVTINVRGKYQLIVEDSVGCFSMNDFDLLVNDTVTANAREDYTLCFGDLLVLDAIGLDTAGNDNTGYYEWFDITNPPGTSLGTNGYLELSATDTQLFRLELYINQEGVTCFDDDTIQVNVNQLPIIDLDPGPDVCENSGDILLTFFNVAPTMPTATGLWYHRTEPEFVSQNRFHTDSANVGDHWVIFNYIEPTTLCVNEDSIRVRIMARTPVELRERDVCQSIMDIAMATGPNQDRVVVRPGNPAVGTQNWSCLNCPDGVFETMLEDRGTPGNPRYFLNVSEDAYTVESPTSIDALTLAYEYINPDGCRSLDTTEIRIWEVPVVLFDRSDPLCHDDGIVNLNELTGVNLLGGRWYVLDTIGFRPSNDLGASLGNTIAGTKKRELLTEDTINTLSSIPLANLGANPGRFYLRYEHDATGCFASNDTTIIINPLPIVSIGEPNPTYRRYCESFDDVPLTASPAGAGGVWTCSDPSGLVGTNFSPSSSILRSEEITLTYTFTNAAGCVSADSIEVLVDPQPTLSIPDDVEFCREQGESQIVLPFEAEVEHAPTILWNTNQDYSSFVSFNLTNSGTNADVTITHQNDRTHVIPIIIFTDGAGSTGSVCDDVDGVMMITVHPIPDAQIQPEIPAGCNPHETVMEFEVFNDIDTSMATFEWNLGLGQFSNEMLPTASYFEDGTTDVTLVITSEHGCDTTLTTSVDAYAIPNAMFRPNPDNFTTAALPRFRFNDLSEVNPVLGSFIAIHEWDFGEIDNPDAVSSEQHPIHVYPADTGTYDVMLAVETNFGCRDSFNYPVVIGPDLLVFVPNAFTPNESGPQENEGFRAVISGEKAMEITIFNRWGEIMFKSTDKNQRWDGTFKGQPCQQDVYAYQLSVTSLDDEIKHYSGTVTLLR